MCVLLSAIEMGLRMPDLVVVAHTANGMEANGKTSIPAETIEKCSTAEVVEDQFGEEPATRKKSILKSSNSDPIQDNGDRLKRTVSWHDFEGKELHTVREFVPSEHDDDEFLYNEPEKKGGCCVIC